MNVLASALWRGPSHEEKIAAVEVLRRYRRSLDGSSWSLLDRFVDDAVGWGLCDALGMGPVAAMVHADRARLRALRQWAQSSNVWRRRVAVYGLRDFVFGGDLDTALNFLEGLLRDEEFWVRRAVGTWLRECWKKDPRRVGAYLRKHAKVLPAMTITVATERASRAFREDLRRRARVSVK